MGLLILLLAVVCAGAQERQQETPRQGGAQREPPANQIITPQEPVAETAAPVDPKTYKIGAEDVLLIRVWREPDLSGPVAVRPDGKFTLPLVGEVMAADLTPEEVGSKITEELSKVMNRPQVIVSVQSVNSKKYYIAGEVNRPGVYPLAVPTTVLQALTGAGGFREFANLKNIVILRGEERIKFNYKDVIKGKNLKQNILVEPGDHIIVQ
jgi:polysaccharide biosynthesis/export protein